MDQEFKDIMNEYNEVTHKMVEWASKQTKTPFAETEDGKHVLGLIADIAMPSALLLIKTSLMMIEDAAIQMGQQVDQDGDR